MSIQSKRLALSLMIAALCAAQPALAQPENTLVGGPQPFAAYDTDGNGSINEQEFNAVNAQQMRDRAAAGAPMGGAANTTTFAVFDRDNNGQVTAAEFAAVQPEPPPFVPGAMGSGAQMGLSGSPGVNPEGTLPSFADLDGNKDGGLSAAEFNDARANRAVERSQEGYPLGSLRYAPPFDTLDLNSDGMISPDEFATVQAQHSQPMEMPPAQR